MLKNYRIGFDLPGLLLFLMIMIPNVIWFVIPAANDVLRTESVTGTVDTIGSICQVLMVASLVIIINRDCAGVKVTGTIIGVSVCILLYYLFWLAYYLGKADIAVLFGLTVFPCVAFLLYSYERKNIIALFFAGAFSVCHLIYTICNYVFC